MLNLAKIVCLDSSDSNVRHYISNCRWPRLYHPDYCAVMTCSHWWLAQVLRLYGGIVECDYINIWLTHFLVIINKILPLINPNTRRFFYSSFGLLLRRQFNFRAFFSQTTFFVYESAAGVTVFSFIVPTKYFMLRRTYGSSFNSKLSYMNPFCGILVISYKFLKMVCWSRLYCYDFGNTFV